MSSSKKWKRKCFLMSFKNRLFLWGKKRIERGAWYFAPFSVFYQLISACKNYLYDHGWIVPQKISCPVVSIGNIVAGGAGKTPLVQMLASRFEHRNVAILTRGYGKFPDEAEVLKRRTQAKVYVGKDRVESAKRAIRDGAELIFLDDGFQHRRLHRDLDLVIQSEEDPLGKGHFLPWGFLRDHPRRLKAADQLFVVGRGNEKQIHIERKVTKICEFGGKEVLSIQNVPVAIFSAIGNPKQFRKTVESLEANILMEVAFADHAIFDTEEILQRAEKKGAQAIVCTEKDVVKIETWDFSIPLYFLEITMQVVEGEHLFEKLIEKIEQTIDNPVHYVK
jgi:tetraacyldisaccharide 4'-kinase